MKKKNEKLLYAIGEIDDELIKNAQPCQKPANGVARKWGITVACLCLVTGVSILSMKLSEPQNQPNIIHSDRENQTEDTFLDNGQQSDGISQEVSTVDENKHDFIAESQNISNTEVQYLKRVSINGKIAEYHQVLENDKINLLDNGIGKPLENTEDWYRISGYDQLQYIIQKEGDTLTLWQFSSFLVNNDDTNITTYSYGTVLQEIYGVTSAQDIVSVTVTPANMNNTDEGKALQQEIGTMTITNKKDIETLYNTLSTITCYGANKWNMIGIGDDTNSLEEVYKGRYLTFTLKNGMQIDSLKYTAISSRFYEYDGIVYDRLEESVATQIEKILGITE